MTQPDSAFEPVVRQSMAGNGASAPTIFSLRQGPVEVQVTDAGASLFRVITPDRDGAPGDIMCGPRLSEHFLANQAYMGATVGRYANRIAGARITLDGQTSELVANEGPNTLHGGESWHRHLWQASIPEQATEPTVRFTYHSPAGEGGFPGNVAAHVRYSLRKDGALQVSFFAETDAPTVVNMTNHAYFNLHGAHYQSLRGHHVRLFAQQFTESGPGNLPSGRILEVSGTPFDLRQPLDIGRLLEDMPSELVPTNGFDHNFVFKTENTEQLVDMALITSPQTGRTLRISSSQPGMQFYTGNYMGGQPGPEPEKTYDNHQAFCCEPQHFPDTPNQPHFPQCTIAPDRPYRQTMVLRFGTQTES